jgi:hypothetical protein
MGGLHPTPSVYVHADPRQPPGRARRERVPEPPTVYAIRVRGVLDPGWSAWFVGMEVHSDGPDESVICGPVADQAALHGLLAKIRDLGLPLISVRTDDVRKPP